ncbi:hypothetical protein [Gimesia sp.]|nr:hypothetical protein [Gimesia sp.]
MSLYHHLKECPNDLADLMTIQEFRNLIASLLPEAGSHRSSD